MSTTERVPRGAAYLTGRTINPGRPNSYGRPPYLEEAAAVNAPPILGQAERPAPDSPRPHLHQVYGKAHDTDPATRAAELQAHFTKQHMLDIAAAIGAIAGDASHEALNFFDAMRVTHEQLGLRQPIPLAASETA